MTGRQRLVVAVSGPDGAGKSLLVPRVAEELRSRGFSVATAYCYGCLVCRNLPARALAGGPAAAPSGCWRWPQAAHALVDGAELAARLAAAWLRARLRSPGRPAAVVTDRGPLDALAKFRPPAGSPAARLLGFLARRYDLVLLLDAPASVLAARDHDHAEPGLAGWRDRYRRWAPQAGRVVRLDTGRLTPDGTAACAAAALPAARPRPAGRGPGPGRVVISIFDSPGNPYYAGGGAVMAGRIARWLADAGFRVTVLTAGRRAGTGMRGGVRYRWLAAGWAGPRAGQLLFHAMLPAAARRIPHDLWIESFTPPFSTSFLPLFTRAPVIGLVQNLSGEEMSHRYRLPFFLIERLGLRCYRDLLVLNPADEARVHRAHPAAAVRVIPNCVELPDPGRLPPGPGEHILFLGRIMPWEKGLDLLLAAYTRSGLAVPLVIAGRGTPADEKTLASQLASAHGPVRWLGQVGGEEKQRLLAHSSFLVLPSRHEAFGLAALEAMAYAKPVLHFDLASLRWMEGDARVPPFDVAALARQLRELATDERRRQALGSQARAAAERYSPQRAADRYLAVVREVLAQARARGQPGDEPCPAR